MGSENRTYARRSIGREAFVKMQIRLLDISRTGARLSSDESIKLPDEFELQISASLTRWSRVVWRDGVQLGVKFIEAPTKRPN
jgi:hypothetical protein